MVISSKAEAENMTSVSWQPHEKGEGCRAEGEQRRAMTFLRNKVGMGGKRHERAAGPLCCGPGLGPVPSSCCPRCQNVGVLGNLHMPGTLSNSRRRISLHPNPPLPLSRQDLSHQTLTDAGVQRLVFSGLWGKTTKKHCLRVSRAEK